jgi:amino acid adenylation domain-containing protein/non-ribosomal peptide synthase protein (TIGR01720 family)/FkbM family methyltransferase
VPEEPTKGFRLSPLQSRLYLAQQGSLSFRAQLAISIEGDLDTAALKEAVRIIVNRHEILRTTFRRLPEMKLPFQVINQNPALSWNTVDLHAQDPAKLECEMKRLFQEEGRRPFDFENGPLLRSSLLVLSPNRHVLSVSLPSLCADGASLKRLFQEISEGYGACLDGKQSVDEPPLQYLQFSEWQNELLERGVDETATEFWRRQDVFSLPELTLPFESKPSGSIPFEPESIVREASPGVVAGIDEVLRTYDSSADVFLLACWQSLLWRLSGQSGIVVGKIFDGRQYQELDEILGPIAKCLPIISRFDRGVRFDEILRGLCAATRDADEWQQGFGLGQVLEATGMVDGHFFPIGFDCETLPESYLAHGVSFSIARQYHCTDRFNLKLHCIHANGSLITEFYYDPQVFGLDNVRRIADHFHILVEAVLANPHSEVDKLNLLSGAERHQLLISSNQTDAPFPKKRCLHHLFEEQVLRSPDSVAVAFQDHQLTYDQLNRRANQLAHHLQLLGARPETFVCIYTTPCLEMIVGILGILKAGAAFIPLDPAHPMERLALILTDVNADIILTLQPLTGGLPEHQARVVCLDTLWETGIELRAANPAGSVTAENLAYGIYTSGSTGKPKGTIISHRAFGNYLSWCTRTFALQDGQGSPAHSSISVDLSLTSLFVPLLVGQRVLLVPQAVGVETLSSVLRNHKDFALVKLTPAHARALSKLLSSEDIKAGARTLVFGGESLDAEDIAFWQADAPQTVLFNEYGPTETVVGCCAYQIPLDPRRNGPIPIGQPISNIRIYILDDHLEPVPLGVSGEIYVSGDGQARGYLRSPELTAQKFLPDPFSPESGGRSYRTGDLARRLSDGNIEFLGRCDQQVKIRGFRVELAEIEIAIRQHPSVREVAVLSMSAGRDGKQLVAYLVPMGEGFHGRKSIVTELRDFLSQKLPDYMVPTAFVLLQALPLGSSGKVDRRALASLDPSQQRSADAFAPPLSMEEEVLAGIWTRVLGVEQVSIDDNFFALGGDSIRSIQVVARARSRGLGLSTEQLFKHQTIRKLGRELRTARAGAAEMLETQAFGLIRPEDRSKMTSDIEDAYPLTRLQAGMIFHREYSPKSTIYHDIFSFHLKVPFESQIFQTVVGRLLNRHPVLRTSFDLTNYTEPLQLVHRSCHVPLKVEDLRDRSSTQQDAVIAAWIESEKRRGFDVASPPLWRFQVHRRTEETIQFTFSFHHAILDGWSDAMMVTELFRHYLPALTADPLVIAPPAASFRDFVALEKLASESSGCRQYWARQLSQGTFVKLPRWQLPARSSNAPEMNVLDVPISGEVSGALKRLALSTAVPIKTVLLAAHLRVMSMLAGHTNPLTCVVSGGRPEKMDGERVLGIHINSIPFGLNLPDGTWTDLVKATFEAELKALPFRRFPTAEIKKMKGGENLSETIFYFTHYHVYQSLKEVAEISVLDHLFHEETSFTLVVYFRLDPFTSHLYLSLTYDRTRIGSGQIQAIGNFYTRALAAMVAEPQQRYQRLSLLSDEEEHQLLVEWNNPWRADDPKECVHQRLELQVERRPDAVAVVSGEEQWTYRQVNQRANQLAGYLMRLGVGPEVRVGLCLERGLEMVVGIVGILKAGGAYVPLDPTWPPQRLAELLAEAQVQVLVSRQALVSGLVPENVRLVCWDRDEEDIARASLRNPINRTLPANAAYVIYTSGSSGVPKGVVVSHANLARLFEATDGLFNFNEDDVWTVFHSFGFDFSVWELWGALVYGGRLVVVSYEVSRSPAAFYDLLCMERCTVLNQTPSAFRQIPLGEAFPDAGQALAVARVILGGEALDLRTVRPWLDRPGPRLEFVNMYGITETTVHVTYRRLREADLGCRASLIGRPIADLQVYILDEQLELVPIGVAGELYVGGGGLARGYLQRPELTGDRFIPHPFSRNGGERLYRSGDLARYLPDGDIEYLGRIDHQVKVRGFRVEPDEIEVVLSQHPAVHQALVLTKEYAPGDKRLVAYLIPDPERASTVTQLLRLEREGQLTHQSQYELPNGMVVVHQNKYETNFVYHEIFEAQSYLKHGITIREGDCIFDVGANIGLFTLLIGQICNGVAVYAFEPIPAVFEALRINTTLYSSNVKLFNCGLSTEVGIGTFTYYPYVSIFSGRFADTGEERAVVKSFLVNHQRSNDPSVTLSEDDLDPMLNDRLTGECLQCSLTTISEVIRQNGVQHIDLLKIDVEKSEFDVLAGIEESDWGKIRQVVVEVHDMDGRLERISAMLRRQGYDLVVEQDVLLQSTGLYNIYAIRPSANRLASEKTDGHSVGRLVSVWRSPNRLISDVQYFLKNKLPEHMVPGHFVLLDALPLTVNGKVDRNALAALDFARPRLTVAVAAHTPVEEQLVRLWTEVLRVDPVGVHDNFFELGGDSILSIQVTAKAKQAGLHLTPKQLFDHPTIAELAAIAITPQPSLAQPVLASDSIPLLPIQHWFFEQLRPDPHHFNQALELEMRQGLDSALLERSVQCLLEKHDALRMRFVESDGDWRQFDGGLDRPLPLLRIDLSALPDAQRNQAMASATSQLQASLNLSGGPLLRIALVDFGNRMRRRLVLIAHHLVVDAVSWRILLADLETAYTQLRAGETPRLSAQTVSFRHWAQRQKEYAGSDELPQELGYWLASFRTPISSLPKDYPQGINATASARVVTESLSRLETRALLQEVSKAFHTQINDVLLTACLQSFARWTGKRSLLVDLEGHGREQIFSDVDPSHTVGWLTALFPVYLEMNESVTQGEALKSTKEQLRRIPGHGLGYGLLRYLRGDADIVERLRQRPQPEVSFNYLGRLDQTLSGSSLFEQIHDAGGQAYSPLGSRKYLIEINGRVTGDRLQMTWTFSENVHRRETIQKLAQDFSHALGSLINYCRTSLTRGYSPSDFPLAGLNQQTLDRVVLSHASIDDIYPLSPAQLGMLFHTLSYPQSGGYFVPLSCELRGRLDHVVFRRAWQYVTDRHPVLRTSCLWEGLDEPLQVVHSQVEIPWEIIDWQGLSAGEQRRRLKTFVQAGRDHGSDLSKAPLMRAALIRLADRTYRFIWTFHHILLDGWSVALLLEEVRACYHAFCLGRDVAFEPSRPYRAFIAWLRQQDLSGAEAFWRQSLKNFSVPPSLRLNPPLTGKENPEQEYQQRQGKLSSQATAALLSLAKQNRLTVNTFVQGAWSVILSHYLGSRDVVFGVTTSGRSVDIVGIESMVGCFINTLPARIRVLPEVPLLLWLKTLQEQQAEIQQFEYSPLFEVLSWSEIPRDRPLFESILVFENYPAGVSLKDWGGGLEIFDAHCIDPSHYPLTVAAALIPELMLTINYDTRRFSEAAIARVLNDFENVLLGMVEMPHLHLNVLIERLQAAGRQRQILEERLLEEATRKKLGKVRRRAAQEGKSQSDQSR